jgi:hypothetical protein
MTTAPKNRAVKDQRKKFVEAARELGCAEDGDSFDEALKKIASAPPPKTVKKRKTKKPAK